MRNIRIGATIALLCAIAMVAGTTTGWGFTATKGHFGYYTHKEDKFLNYDLDGVPGEDFETFEEARHHVDWPFAFLFFGFSSEHVVKNLFGEALPASGSPIHALVNNGAGWDLDEDKGRKEGRYIPLPLGQRKLISCKVFGKDMHYRIYGPNGHSFYSHTSNWGYYNIASIHYDHDECSLGLGDEWAGESEEASGAFARLAIQKLGRRDVSIDYADWNNQEARRTQEGSPDHHWDFGGKVTYIRITRGAAEATD